MYVLHPAVVHFPIALLVVNLLLTLSVWRRPDAFRERAAYGALVLGWWGTLAAVASGTIAAALAWPLAPEVLPWLNAHFVLGIALLIVYGRALLWRRSDPDVLASGVRGRYLGLLLLGGLLLVVDGWIGGHMVYRLGVGVGD